MAPCCGCAGCLRPWLRRYRPVHRPEPHRCIGCPSRNGSGDNLRPISSGTPRLVPAKHHVRDTTSGGITDSGEKLHPSAGLRRSLNVAVIFVALVDSAQHHDAAIGKARKLTGNQFIHAQSAGNFCRASIMTHPITCEIFRAEASLDFVHANGRYTLQLTNYFTKLSVTICATPLGMFSTSRL